MVCQICLHDVLKNLNFIPLWCSIYIFKWKIKIPSKIIFMHNIFWITKHNFQNEIVYMICILIFKCIQFLICFCRDEFLFLLNELLFNNFSLLKVFKLEILGDSLSKSIWAAIMKISYIRWLKQRFISVILEPGKSKIKTPPYFEETQRFRS